MIDFPDFSDHLIAFLLGVLLPVVSGLHTARTFRKLSFDEIQRSRFYLLNSSFLWFVTLIVLLNWMFHKRPFEEMGLTSSPHFSTIVIALSSGFAALYVLDLIISSGFGNEKKKNHWTDVAPFLPTHNRQLPAYVFMCITAGVCEEIIFRGFLIPYTKTFFTSDIPAVIIPAAVFAVAHYYQRTAAVIKIFILSALFGYIFLESGSLWIVMFLHFAIDLAGGLIVMKEHRKGIDKSEVQNFPKEPSDQITENSI